MANNLLIDYPDLVSGCGHSEDMANSWYANIRNNLPNVLFVQAKNQFVPYTEGSLVQQIKNQPHSPRV